MKTCTKCKIEKDESEFYKHPNGKLGLCPSCKECCKKKILKIENTDYKTCSKCKIEKEKKEFHKSNREKCGFTSLCKVCSKNDAKKRRQKYKNRKNVESVNYKICPKCKIEKKGTDFRKDAQQKDGLFTWCIKCHKEYTKERDAKIAQSEKAIILFKVCYNCKDKKDINKFSKNKTKKDGYSGVCKECTYNYIKNNYEYYLNKWDIYLKKNRVIINERRKKTAGLNRENLSDQYLKKILIYDMQYPKEMIDQNPIFLNLFREKIKFKRLLYGKAKTKTSKES